MRYNYLLMCFACLGLSGCIFNHKNTNTRDQIKEIPPKEHPCVENKTGEILYINDSRKHISVSSRRVHENKETIPSKGKGLVQKVKEGVYTFSWYDKKNRRVYGKIEVCTCETTEVHLAEKFSEHPCPVTP